MVLDFHDGALIRRWLQSDNIDEPLGVELYSGTTAGGTGTAHELYADRLGSITKLVEAATGTVAGAYRYDSFGNRTATGLSLRYGFTGREVDDESGLIYFRARHYDPALGQFVQRDPIGFAGGDANLYAYAWNDPYSWTDPSGLAVAGSETGSFVRLSQRTVAWSIDAVEVLIEWCSANPACRLAALQGIKSGIGQLGQSLGVGAPSGSTTGGTSGAAGNLGASTGSGPLGQVFGGILGAVDKINQELASIDFPNIVQSSPPNDAKDPNGAKAPGKPGVDEGFADPKGGEEWVKNPNGKGGGWLDDKGRVWVPTGQKAAHGGPHWDVQGPKGEYINVYPGGKTRT